MYAPVCSTHVYLSHTNVFKVSDRAPSPETCVLQGNAFVFKTLLANPAGGNCWRCLCPLHESTETHVCSVSSLPVGEVCEYTAQSAHP